MFDNRIAARRALFNGIGFSVAGLAASARVRDQHAFPEGLFVALVIAFFIASGFYYWKAWSLKNR